MEASLLKTKVCTPELRPQTVLRARLMQRLKVCINCNLVLISAPAGFGKTTLLTQWAHESQPRPHVAWISIDESDNDPVRFWRYLIAAVQTLRPSAGKIALDLLRSSQPAPVEPLLTALINDLALEIEDFIIVIDDYHLITNKSIHAGIIFLLEHLSACLHLVIVTRADPPLPLARFRGKGLMMEIGADELRFTHDEATSFFKEVDKPELTREEVEALNTRTEGWAVGLKMAALSARHQREVPSFVRDFTGSQRYVLDYLVEEVLNRQTPEVRNFLLQTSVLEKFCAPLCNYVTRCDTGLKMLPDLERGNLFLVALDESREWYRYEHLFSDFLRHQLGVEFGADHVRLLHNRASQWYQDNGFSDEAVEHSLAAQDWGKAIKLIKEDTAKFRNGEFQIFVDWIKKLPEETWYEDLHFCHVYAVALISTLQLDVADSLLDHIEAIATSRGVDVPQPLSAARCMIASYRGDISRTLELGRQALLELPPESGDARSGIGLFLGGAQWNKGLFKEAETLYSTALHDASMVGNNVNKFWALAALGGLHTVFGNMHKARESHCQALALMEQFPYAARSQNGLALLLYEWNDLEQADYHLGRAIELARKVGYMSSLVWAYFERARINLVRGDEKAFSDSLAEADRLVGDNSSPQDKAVQAVNHVRIAILRDDLASIASWGSRLIGYTQHLTFFNLHVPIRLQITWGRKAEANEQLRAMYEEAAEAGAGHSVIIARVYQALTASDSDAAVTSLGDALTIAEPEGWIRTFVDEGRLLGPLLRKAISRGIKPDYAGKLLTIIEAEERQRQARKGEIIPSSPASGLLSEREMEVLRLVAEGLSDRQIAGKLVISLSTAKTHVHHIFEKLNSKDRLQAVNRAKDLRLI